MCSQWFDYQWKSPSNESTPANTDKQCLSTVNYNALEMQKKNINFLNISKKIEPATKKTQENRNSDKAVRVKLFANSL